MSARARTEVPCEVCGTLLNLVSRARRHCQTDDCRLGYVIKWYLREESYDSEGHMYWSGPRGTKSASSPGVAMAYAADYETNLNKRQYRVLDIAALVHEGKPFDTTRRWKNKCGDLACVALEHWQLGARTGDRKDLSQKILARLDAAPLLALVDVREYRDAKEATVTGAMVGAVTMMPRSHALSVAIQTARKQGYLTVSAADAICIDYLGVHPYDVYGDLFYEVGTDAA